MAAARRAALTTAVLVSALGAGACGRTLGRPDMVAPRVQEPVAAEAPRPPSAVAEERRRASLHDTALRRSVERAVRGYYTALERKDFTRAWSQLSPKARGQLGGRAAWRRDLVNNVGQSVSVRAREVAPSRATVAVTLKRTDYDACGRSVTRRFSGTWQLVRESTRWVAASVALARVGGGTPISRASACPGTRPVDPPHPRTTSTPRPQIEHRHHGDDEDTPSEPPPTETDSRSADGDLGGSGD